MRHLKRCFWDLDHTMYDTDRMIALVNAELSALGHSLSDIQRARALTYPMGYSFERHLAHLGYPSEVVERKVEGFRAILQDGDALLFPDTVQELKRASEIADCILLTFGFQPYQENKFNSIGSLQTLFPLRHYAWTDRSKGEIIQSYGEHPNTWFIDDAPHQLIDVLAKAPWTHCVRICRPEVTSAAHPDDGIRWPVVTDLRAFVTLVESAP